MSTHRKHAAHPLEAAAEAGDGEDAVLRPQRGAFGGAERRRGHGGLRHVALLARVLPLALGRVLGPRRWALEDGGGKPARARACSRSHARGRDRTVCGYRHHTPTSSALPHQRISITYIDIEFGILDGSPNKLFSLGIIPIYVRICTYMACSNDLRAHNSFHL